MTKDQIIRLAKEAGIRDCTCDGDFGCIERFAVLVAAHVREPEKQIETQLIKMADENQRIRAELKFNTTKREWVGLTDVEIDQGQKESWVTKQAWESAVWWAEEKLKLKNHD